MSNTFMKQQCKPQTTRKLTKPQGDHPPTKTTRPFLNPFPPKPSTHLPLSLRKHEIEPWEINTRFTMGSKVSKLKEQATDGKLQPSQNRQDKEEMKEPSNYYTHRSKSMRRKAGKTGATSGSGGAVGGTAGGGGGIA
jgi:hypothetical protein